uniref:Uncharacterized protein n=1 Tax=Rhizophagus irregularis (strain DAOM 181602 / DAOM 197198 / MUCL 43194) TaxID=747089 RepID=U9SRN4_RHIID
MRKIIEDFDNYLEKSPLALRVVPLPEFTIDRIPQKNVEQNHRLKIALNIFLFLFIPRWYKISRDKKKLLSPFSRVVRYENNDDMYDNPATEAILYLRLISKIAIYIYYVIYIVKNIFPFIVFMFIVRFT